MLHASFKIIGLLVLEKILKGFTIYVLAAILVMCSGPFI